MSKYKQRNPPNRQILEEAAEWFVDFREGLIDADGRNAFNIWLRRSPEHILAYLEVATFWAAVPQMGSEDSIDLSALAAAARADDKVIALESAAGHPRNHQAEFPPGAGDADLAARRTFPRSPLLLAASMCIAILTAGLGVWRVTHRAPEYITQVGEQRTVTLSDGSRVELNSRSHIRVRYSGRERDIDLLEGQALFNVARDTAKPFVVRSGETVLRALGTEFDVYRKRSGTTVTVLEGRVAVDGNDGRDSTQTLKQGSAIAPAGALSSPMVLSAGEQATVSTSGPIRPTHTNIAAATAWTQGHIVFESARLSDVVEEFNRYNSRQMIVEDPRVADVRIAAVFSSTDAAALLQFLRATPGFRVSETDSEIRIGGN
jgi:transmembrane sensor